MDLLVCRRRRVQRAPRVFHILGSHSLLDMAAAGSPYRPQAAEDCCHDIPLISLIPARVPDVCGLHLVSTETPFRGAFSPNSVSH